MENGPVGRPVVPELPGGGGRRVRAITTDASPLYPEPIAQVFGAVPHQLCAFHVIKALAKAILRAVAQERKRLAAQQPSLPRGRPSTRPAKYRSMN